MQSSIFLQYFTESIFDFGFLYDSGSGKSSADRKSEKKKQFSKNHSLQSALKLCLFEDEANACGYDSHSGVVGVDDGSCGGGVGG